MLKLFLISFSIGSSVFAGQCLKGSFMNKNYEYELLNAKESLVKEFRDLTGMTKTTGQLGCVNCSQKQESPLNQKIAYEVPKECIVGALKRQIFQKTATCSNGKVIMRGNLTSKNSPCVDDNVASYITYISNKVLNCFNSLTLKGGRKLQIDPKTFFSKINNESGFNFSPVYKGGVGVGQLTGIAVREMNVLNSGHAGNGRYILDSLMLSSSSQCSGLQEIIKNDKVSKLNNPRNPLCEWVSINRGLPRSLVYSIGYFSFVKQSLGKELRKRAPRFKYDEEFLDMLTLVGYGPKGPARAKALIRSLALNSNNLKNLKKSLKAEAYLKDTSKKLKEAQSKAGGSCSLG